MTEQEKRKAFMEWHRMWGECFAPLGERGTEYIFLLMPEKDKMKFLEESGKGREEWQR